MQSHLPSHVLNLAEPGDPCQDLILVKFSLLVLNEVRFQKRAHLHNVLFPKPSTINGQVMLLSGSRQLFYKLSSSKFHTTISSNPYGVTESICIRQTWHSKKKGLTASSITLG